MDNKGFIDALARRLDVSRKDAIIVAEAVSTAVIDCCVEGDSIAIPGFGNFETKKKLERIMAVPTAGGKRLLIPPKIVMTFKPSALLKQRLPQNLK